MNNIFGGHIQRREKLLGSPIISNVVQRVIVLNCITKTGNMSSPLHNWVKINHILDSRFTKKAFLPFYENFSYKQRLALTDCERQHRKGRGNAKPDREKEEKEKRQFCTKSSSV